MLIAIRINLGPNRLQLAVTYNDIGQVHVFMKNDSLVLSRYEEVLKIRQKSLHSDDSDLTDTYNKITQVRDLMKNEGNDI